MAFVPLLHFFTFATFTYLAIYVILKDRKALINRLCGAFLLSFSIWSFTLVIAHNPDVSKETAILFHNMGSFGWVPFSSFFLWFTLVYTKRKNILKNKLLVPALFAPPAYFIFRQWTGSLFAGYLKHSYGWAPLWGNLLNGNLFIAYLTAFMMIGIFLLFDYGRKQKNKTKKRQTNILLFSSVIVFELASSASIALPKMNVFIMPDMAPDITLIWAFTLVYVIGKYRFLAISATTAADNIISAMSDLLVLLDPEGKIISANPATVNMLGYKEEDLKGKPGIILFSRKHFETGQLDRLLREGDIHEAEFFLRSITEQDIPVSFSSSILRDDLGRAVGTVCVARDMTELRKVEERFRSLVRNSSDVIAIIDKGGIIRYQSDSIYRVLGYKPAEQVGKHMSFNVHPDDIPVVKDSFERACRRPGITVSVECRVRKADDSWIVIEAVVTNRLNNPAIEGMVVNFRDITERKRANDQIKEKIAALEQVKKTIISREMAMIEIKKKINSLYRELGRRAPYG